MMMSRCDAYIMYMWYFICEQSGNTYKGTVGKTRRSCVQGQERGREIGTKKIYSFTHIGQ